MKIVGHPSIANAKGQQRLIRLGTLDDDPAARPDVHIHVASKAPWYEINDDIPQLEEEEGLWF